MTATVTVRDATGHDVAELAALAASAYRETYRTMMDAGVTEAVIAQSCTAPGVHPSARGRQVRGRHLAGRNGILPHRGLPRLPLRG